MRLHNISVFSTAKASSGCDRRRTRRRNIQLDGGGLGLALDDSGLEAVEVGGADVVSGRACYPAMAQGVPMLDVSWMLGHSQINTTSDLYTDVFDKARTATARAMDRALRAPSRGRRPHAARSGDSPPTT